jgi:hypothetical protein
MRHLSVAAFKPQNGQFVAIEFIVCVALPVMREAARFAPVTFLEFDQFKWATGAEATDHDPVFPGFGHADRIDIPEFLTDRARTSDHD